MTVLLVEQNVRMALLLAEYGYVIRDGVVHLQGPAEQMISDQNLQHSYLGGTVADRGGVVPRPPGPPGAPRAE